RSRLMPPPATSMSTCRACASMLFSISSFSAAAGRSTTSPAAIWLTMRSGSARMCANALALVAEFFGPARVHRIGDDVERAHARLERAQDLARRLRRGRGRIGELVRGKRDPAARDL